MGRARVEAAVARGCAESREEAGRVQHRGDCEKGQEGAQESPSIKTGRGGVAWTTIIHTGPAVAARGAGDAGGPEVPGQAPLDLRARKSAVGGKLEDFWMKATRVAGIGHLQRPWFTIGSEQESQLREE